MRNLKILLSGIILVCCISFYGHNFQKKKTSYSNESIFDIKKLDGNRIGAYFKNTGEFNRNNDGDPGFEWPNGTDKILTYASGLWLAAKVSTDTLGAIACFGSEYFPGYIDINGISQGKDDPAFRIYKITRGDTTSEDYLNWPVSQGAYLDSIDKPIMPGNQTMFYSFTDGYPESHGLFQGNTAPLKAQVQVTNWCYSGIYDPVLSDVIFSEFKIINKNSLLWNNAIISLWSDECAYEFVAIGCDTNLNLGYAYCELNTQQYGNNPPAFGFLLLQGAAKYTGNSNDTVYTFIPGNSHRRARIGYKELKVSSVNMFENNSIPYGEPFTFRQTYLTMQGLKKNGEPWIVPGTTAITKFPFSGDPESGTGWNQFTTMSYGNRRLLVSLGFIDFNPGDTQSIIVAQIVSQGSNNLNSVTKLKKNSEYVLNLFNQNFTAVGITNGSQTNVQENFELHQNYPNPFNPVTKIKFDLKKSGKVKLVVYDMTGKEVAALVDKVHNAGENEVIFDSNNIASGVYFYNLTVNNFSKTMKMVLLK